jgi:branched-chain amino acid transport system substrate-binding protein
MEVAAKHKKPHFFALGATKVVNETWQSDPDKYFYWAMKGWPEPGLLTTSYVQAIEDAIERGLWTPEARTVSLWGEETDWARSFNEGLRQQLEAVGWEVVSEDYFPLDQTEFVPLLTRIKELNPALFAGTASAAPLYSALIKQADEVGLESMIVADGLGWVGNWYDITGDSSNHVIDQIPQWATEEGLAFATEFEDRVGYLASTSSAGLAYDYANMFIALANDIYGEQGELTSENLADFAKNKLQTGEWSYTGGLVMDEYKVTPETAPDPVVGKGLFIFPVTQYFDGEGKIIFPPEWAVQDFEPKP